MQSTLSTRKERRSRAAHYSTVLTGQGGEVTQTLQEHVVQEGSSDCNIISPFPTLINEQFQNG